MGNKKRYQGMTSRVRRGRAIRNQAQIRFQPDYQKKQENGPKLNKNQSIDRLAGYNMGCCPSTSSFYLRTYLCSKCLLRFHVKCISKLTSDDREALRNKQWVCSKCKEQVIVEQNEMKKRAQDEVVKKMLEIQNEEKSIALESVDDLKLKNKELEMKLGDISKWVKEKFGADIPEEIQTEAEIAFDYIKVLREQYPSFSKSPVIEINRILISGSGIEDKTSESTMKNRCPKKTKKKRRSRYAMAIEREKNRRMPMKLFMEKLREQIRVKKESRVPLYTPSKPKKILPKIFKCPRENCETMHESTMALHYHIKIIHDKMTVNKRPAENQTSEFELAICHYCGKYFVTQLSMSVHIKHVHERKKYPRPPSQKEICHYCGKTFLNDKYLHRHISRIHELGPERFKCPEDNSSKIFATQQDLKKHKDTHDEPAEYLKCTEEGCVKRFKNKKSLKYHLEIHAAKGVRNFTCLICDKTFMTRNCLSAHKRMSHAKEINHEFMCTFEGCNLGYSVRRYLEDHLKTHDPNYQPPAKQKLIICQFCAKEYETFPQLNRHILNVHEK